METKAQRTNGKYLSILSGLADVLSECTPEARRRSRDAEERKRKLEKQSMGETFEQTCDRLNAKYQGGSAPTSFEATLSLEQHQDLRLADGGFPRAMIEAKPGADQGWMANARKMAARSNKGGLFIIVGSQGTGKSSLATYGGRGAITFGLSVLYVVWPRLIDRIKGSNSPSSRLNSQQILHPFRFTDFLVIDDIQGKPGTEYESSMLVELVRWRHQEHKTTVLVSEGRTETLVSLLGTSIAERVNEDQQKKSGGFIVLSTTFRNQRTA